MTQQGILRIFLLLAALLFSGPIAAQMQGGKAYITPTLIAESAAPAPGSTVMLALEMKVEPGWHGYWINPGDAGGGVDAQWTLPAGVKAGDIRYPIPSKLIVQGLMNHVYKGDYTLLVPLTLGKDMVVGTSIPIATNLNFLACSDTLCVPQRATLRTQLKVGDGAVTPADRAKFDSFRTKMPKPLGTGALFQRDGKTVRLDIPLPQSVLAKDIWFFPKTEYALLYAAPQKVERSDDRLILEAQAGDEAPETLEGLLSLGNGQGFTVTAKPGTVAESTGEGADFLLALGGALLGGLLLNIMPCVFPIISLKALSVARAGASEREARVDSVAYSVGVVVTCLALGGLLLGLRASGVAVGWAFQLQNPWIIALLLVLAVAITLNLLGVFHLRSIGAGDALTRKSGAAGAFWTGALAAFVATPCTGPFMAAALGAALVLPVASALAIFAGLGLGMAIPFLSIGFVPAIRNRFPKPGAWMITFQRIMAIPMALTALALAWLLWQQWGPSVQNQADKPEAFTESALTEARKTQTVFLYFTADWCVTCKVNEKAAIEREEVEAAFKAQAVRVMVGDWTNGDPAITRFLESQGRSGVPLYLVYRKGASAPEILPQILTPAIIVDAVKP
jgi:DsbC/DsbD-like thiol-disulfide interchange protein/cytochrome c biogenesis protein CcdA